MLRYVVQKQQSLVTNTQTNIRQIGGHVDTGGQADDLSEVSNKHELTVSTQIFVTEFPKLSFQIVYGGLCLAFSQYFATPLNFTPYMSPGIGLTA